MTAFSRALRALLPLALVVPALAPAPALAQASACTILRGADDPAPEHARPDDPWIYRGTDIPVDREWLMGELPNGLRYAVRQNGVPPCQVSLRIAIDAGSLHEEEHERGYAHLIEHLVFRESRDFGPSEAIPYFQRLGAALGYDTNATTSPTQTVYQLDLPNANRTTLGDAVRLFAGMIREPALSAENIAADLPIVLAERRDSAGPARRVADATRETLFAGQRLAARSTIGTPETLEAATPETVRAFHRRWYRPENAVVILVGDADPQVLAALVEREFGDWRGVGPLVPAPAFGDPTAPAGAPAAPGSPPVGEVAVVVEPGQPRNLTFAVLRPWRGVVDTLEYNRGILTDEVAIAVVNRRLEERARAGASFLFAAVSREKTARSVDGTFVTLAPLGPDWRAALEEVRAVIAGALAEPPSQAEIDREAAAFELQFAGMVEQARIQAAAQLADTVVGALDIREAIAAPETFQTVFRSLDARLNPATILAHTQRLFAGEVVRAVLLTPEAGEADERALTAALAAPVAAQVASGDTGAAISFADLPAIGAEAQPVAGGPLGIAGVERVDFANGVRALLYDRDNEPGRVTVRVRFGGGWRAVAPEEAVYARLGQLALVNSGIGPLGQNELDRIAAGRRLSFDFRIEDGAFVFEGLTRAEDLADQLWLLAAKLAMPRWDAAPFERARASAQLGYDSLGADPQGVINRDLDWLLHGRDPRFATPGPAQLAAADAAGFRATWERLMAQGPVEVAVFGDIDPDATIAALSRTFGALPARGALPPEVAAQVLPGPEPSASPVRLFHGGDGEQAAAIVMWPTAGGSERLTESRKLDLLAQIVSNRLLDELRERVGAAYSPFVGSNWPLDSAGGGAMFALAQIEPALLGEFFAAADEIAADLAANGPRPDELARVVEPARQAILRAQTGHTFWLNQLQGASFDRARVLGLSTIWRDYDQATPAELREVAARYLGADRALRVEIVPGAAAAPGVSGAGR